MKHTTGTPRLPPRSSSNFAKELYTYLEKQELTSKAFAEDCGFRASHVAHWLHGYKSKSGKLYPGYVHILKMYHSKHRDFIVNCIDKGVL